MKSKPLARICRAGLLAASLFPTVVSADSPLSGFPDSADPAARKGWIALTDHVQPDGDVREVCVGTNTANNREYYMDRPRAVGDMHGQAPVLWCATALLRKPVSL